MSYLCSNLQLLLDTALQTSFRLQSFQYPVATKEEAGILLQQTVHEFFHGSSSRSNQLVVLEAMLSIATL